MLRARHLVVGLALCWAQASLAFDPFTVRDIRVEGLQRTEPGTIFGYLPVKVGERMTEENNAMWHASDRGICSGSCTQCAPC